MRSRCRFLLPTYSIMMTAYLKNSENISFFKILLGSVADPGSYSWILVFSILDSGFWILDPGSWILDPGSRISDPRSNNNKKEKKKGTFFLSYLFCSHKFHKKLLLSSQKYGLRIQDPEKSYPLSWIRELRSETLLIRENI
jgi:hypothetical protein